MTNSAKALERAEYMAFDAERLLKAVREREEILLRRAESDDVDDQEEYDSHATVEERAKALRESIHEFWQRRNLAAPPAVQVRAQALEEAAVTCEGKRAQEDTSIPDKFYNAACDACAAAIRALKEQP